MNLRRVRVFFLLLFSCFCSVFISTAESPVSLTVQGVNFADGCPPGQQPDPCQLLTLGPPLQLLSDSIIRLLPRTNMQTEESFMMQPNFELLAQLQSNQFGQQQKQAGQTLAKHPSFNGLHGYNQLTLNQLLKGAALNAVQIAELL